MEEGPVGLVKLDAAIIPIGQVWSFLMMEFELLIASQNLSGIFHPLKQSQYHHRHCQAPLRSPGKRERWHWWQWQMAAWMAQKMSTVFAAAKCSGGERERELATVGEK